MTKKRDYPRDMFNAVDGARRVGWAKYFTEKEHREQMQYLCHVYRDRVDVLLDEFLGLTDAVLYERNIEAFNRAYRAKLLVDEFLEGAPA